MTIDPGDVTRLIAMQLGCPTIRPEDRLIEDLNASSVDLVNLTVALEDRFEIELSETDVAISSTVADVHALIGRLSSSRGR